METTVSVTKTDKQGIYEEIVPQLRSLLEGETDKVANLANAVAVLKLAFPDRFSWVGFYLTAGGDLLLGPFQGKPACVRIGYGKGVCGSAAEKKRTLIVSDVHAFPGHIACDPESRSEIVVPMLRGQEVVGVLDVDSNRLSSFDETDRRYLEEIVTTIEASIRNW